MPTRTRLIFLQHPREARVAIGTARMAHLALPNSELHEGFTFPGLAALADEPDAAVLFPGPLVQAPALPPRTLVVVDGTWPQARKLIRRNPLLARMRRVGIRPARPGAYRIRREPTPDCLATVEAVAEVLGLLEGEPARFADLLTAFTFMVERQLEHARTRPVPRRQGHREPRLAMPELADLVRSPDDAVLVHAEANAHGASERVAGAPEIVHLVATRIAGARRFEALIAPRRPLGARTAFHLGLGEEQLRAGLTVPEALARLAAFLRPDDRLCGWGRFAADLLEREGLPARPRVDLRAAAARRLPGHPRGIDRVAGLLDVGAASPWAAGRAGRFIVALEGIYLALLARARRIDESSCTGPGGQ